MATADLAEDSGDVGVGDTPQEAVRAALRGLGEPYASEMAAQVEARRASLRAKSGPHSPRFWNLLRAGFVM
jgi:ABC-type Fe3+ transport system substrate-binding protein